MSEKKMVDQITIRRDARGRAYLARLVWTEKHCKVDGTVDLGGGDWAELADKLDRLGMMTSRGYTTWYDDGKLSALPEELA